MKVKVRSIRPDDKERLVAAFKNLDPESIYTRFFYHKKMLSEAELKSATELDFEKAVALVVTTGRRRPGNHHRGRPLRRHRRDRPAAQRGGGVYGRGGLPPSGNGPHPAAAPGVHRPGKRPVLLCGGSPLGEQRHAHRFFTQRASHADAARRRRRARDAVADGGQAMTPAVSVHRTKVLYPPPAQAVRLFPVCTGASRRMPRLLIVSK